MSGHTVAGVVLAAGGGRRMGGPKALIEVGGTPLVSHALTTLRDGGCDPVAVVIGAAAAEVRTVVRATARDAAIIRNTGWADGMSTSVRAALSWAAMAGGDAVVLLPVDTPGITAAVVDRMRCRWTGADAAVVATYGGAPRNPVLLSAGVWSEVAASVHGDDGARRWLRANPGRVVHVDCTDLGDPADIDSPDDLRRWTRTAAATEGEQHGT